MQDVSLISFVSNLVIAVVGYGMLLGALEAVGARMAEVRQLEPVERNLQRVSHGVAYITGTLAVIFGGYWPLAIDAYTSIMPASAKADLGLPLVAALIMGASAFRIRAGLRAFRFFNPEFQESTPLLRPRAAVKTALGIGGLVYLAHNRDAYLYASGWWVLAYAALWLAAAWCAVTGPVRLFLLRRRRLDGGNVEPPEWNWN